MGFKKYRGDVVNVETAMLAHRVLEVQCQRCGRSSSMWAYKVNHRGTKWGILPLGRPVKGFHCNGCGRSVLVILEATGPWDR